MGSIYKRGRIYWAKIQRDRQVLRRSLKTSSRTEAERRFRKLQEDLELISWGEFPPVSFDDALISYIDEYLPTLKVRSAKRYATSIKKLVESFEGLALHQIGSRELAGFEKTRRKDGVRPPTIIRDLSCLSSIFSFAEDHEWIDGNPVPKFLRRRAKRGLKNAPPRIRYLTEEEEGNLLHLSGGVLRDAIVLSIDTGLRCQELLSLTWDRIDLHNNTLSTGSDTKTGTSRTIPILPRSADILRRIPRHIMSRYVLCHPSGKRFTTFRKGFGLACAKAGIVGVRWHDLRRTCGCRLLQRHGMGMHEVSMWLGHASIRTTETTYAFLRVEDLQQAVTKTGTGNTD